MRVLSRDEQKRLAVYLLDGTDFCKFGVLLMLFTGLRIGELCALRWSDVNIKEKVISVSASAFGRGVRRTPAPLKPFERRVLWI